MEVKIQAGDHSYRALIGSRLLDSVGANVRTVLPNAERGIVVADTTVGPLFADRVQTSLRADGFDTILSMIAAGEFSKNLAEVGQVVDKMVQAGLDRQSFVIGLGGGVVGDLSGFIAAIYHRGVPHIQIPTTLLAMVDSSIGGKTGVNTRAGKNLIGAVHHPSLVLSDPDVLQKLPARELNQGFAEVIKHAIIADPEMFRTLPELDRHPEPLIERNVRIKRTLWRRMNTIEADGGRC